MKIPHLLILFRFLLSPVIIFLALNNKHESKLLIVLLMYLGLLSDIFDGIIARKQNISTEKLRRLDSLVDLIFWISIAIGIWILNPALFHENKVSILVIFILEALCYIISFLKFGKEASTHAFLSKIWGLTLVIAFTSLIGLNYAGIPFYVSVIIGVISHIDVILIILILPEWTHDIPSAYHAYLIRKNISFKKTNI